MSHTRSERRRALIYTPNTEGPHPVLCFLHGAGEAATNHPRGQPQAPFPQFIDKLDAHKSPPWQAAERRPHIGQFLVVSPQLEKRRRWTRDDAGWVNEIVDEAIDKHGGDVNRQVLTGFSYGGEGAFLLADADPRNPRRWRAIWAVDPAIQDGVPPAFEVPARIWVDHGNASFGNENRAELVRAFNLNAAPNRVIRDIGEGPERALGAPGWGDEHNRTCEAAYNDASTYAWILQ